MGRGTGTRAIRITDAQGRALAVRGFLTRPRGRNGYVELEGAGKGLLAMPNTARAGAVTIVPQTPGYWMTHRSACRAGDAIACEMLDGETRDGWWHMLLGDHAQDAQRGRGIRIGVVDSSFSHRHGLEAVKQVHIDGGASRPRAGDYWHHGEAVCRILGDSKAPPGCAAIAPGADLLFADASFRETAVRHPRFRIPTQGSADDDLDPTLVAKAIFALAIEHEVDLINLSLGIYGPIAADDDLAATIRLARLRGVAFVCAGGNEPRDEGAAFPANLRHCIGVGGYGPCQGIPATSQAHHLGTIAEDRGQVKSCDIFLSPRSAYGDGIDTLAPGVGVIIARNGKPAFDLAGTSFAAPIVTGLLAVALARDETYLAQPRDERRARRAEQRLRDLCIPTGIFPDWEGDGAVRLS